MFDASTASCLSPLGHLGKAVLLRRRRSARSRRARPARPPNPARRSSRRGKATRRNKRKQNPKVTIYYLTFSHKITYCSLIMHYPRARYRQVKVTMKPVQTSPHYSRSVMRPPRTATKVQLLNHTNFHAMHTKNINITRRPQRRRG
jgi:hypothetical protein